MNKIYKLSLFIFRRDLRLSDNTGLNQALSLSDAVIPCFILNPEQLGSKNSYASENSIQFMAESLKDLQQQLVAKHGHLYLFAGTPRATLDKLLKHTSIDAVFVNKDYTPYSQERDAQLETISKKHKVDFLGFDDALLNAPQNILNKSGKPYTLFTPYYRTASSITVDAPHTLRSGSFYTKKLIPEAKLTDIAYDNKNIFAHGGTDEAKKIVRALSKFEQYQKTRDIPALATTGLSAHNKFGTLSIREVYHAIEGKLGRHHPLIRQLYWRDFFTQVAFYFPYVFGHAFHKKYNTLEWHNSAAHFKKWCTGTTGFPIVDAGMRQLNATGYMHNRVRMIVASFLVKDLHIDWQWGEKYFAQQLVDYDPAVNNGNWQWSASTGCDAQPYFRIFNPWTQQKKFDPECVYIKHWVPELANIPAKIIHTLYKQEPLKDYYKPMVDHDVEAKLAKQLYARHR